MYKEALKRRPSYYPPQSIFNMMGELTMSRLAHPHKHWGFGIYCAEESCNYECREGSLKEDLVLFSLFILINTYLARVEDKLCLCWVIQSVL